MLADKCEQENRPGSLPAGQIQTDAEGMSEPVHVWLCEIGGWAMMICGITNHDDGLNEPPNGPAKYGGVQKGAAI